MRLTNRDKWILEAIHAHDGMLGFSQIKRLFFTAKSQAQLRLKLLYQHKYVNRPNQKERYHVPEMIYWLDRRGAEYVAGLKNMSLRALRWRKKPRWNQVEHDLAVNNFRLTLSQSCRDNKKVELLSWVPEGEFWSNPDPVVYWYGGRKLKRFIRPDGYFSLKITGHRLSYLLEIDRSTEDNPRFLREKIIPGLKYVKSEVYRVRFGRVGGRWLVVTTGERRMSNILRQARRRKAKGLFYVTTFDRVNETTVLLSPIWRRADRNKPVPLLFMD